MIERIIRGIMKPELIGDFLKSRINLIPYRLHSTKAFKPNIIYIVINSTCNLRCKMCDVGQMQQDSHFYKNLKGDSGEISIKKYKEIIDEVSKFKPKIVFSSTEPLLYKDIIDAVKYTKSKGLKMCVTTNGFLLPKFANLLVDAGLDELIVSVDGPQKVHDEIRGVPGCFNNLYEGIRLVNGRKEALGLKTPAVRINFTITEFNYDKIMQTIKAVEPLSPFEITINHMNFVTKEMKEIHNKVCRYKATESCISATDVRRINLEKLNSELQKVRKTYPPYLIPFVPDLDKEQLNTYYLSPLKAVPRHDRCLVTWQVAQISSNGDVIPLTRCFNAVMGNVYKESFSKIWNGKRYREFRKWLLERKNFPACMRCCGIF